MDIGLMMDCDYPEGQTAHEAFEAALKMAEEEQPDDDVMLTIPDGRAPVRAPSRRRHTPIRPRTRPRSPPLSH